MSHSPIDVLGRSARAAAMFAAFVATASLGGMARAADIPTVTIADGVPNRDIPLGTTFALAGAVDDSVVSVRAVVVRTGFNTLFGTTGPTCEAFLRSRRPR